MSTEIETKPELRYPTPRELHTALYAVFYALDVINAHVEHRAVSAVDVKQFYAAVEELEAYTEYENPSHRAEELEVQFPCEMGLK